MLVLLAASACASARQTPRTDPAAAPLLILVSLDGWRWDYDRTAPAPNLRALAARGVRADALIPGFPTKTIPNHYSIATGLYPGRHGMVANVIFDPSSGRLFRRTDRAEVEDPMWWGGDPIWNTLQRAGYPAATMFWPGTEAPVGGMRPRRWREFDENVPSAARVDQVLAWLDLPESERPRFITLYLQEVDRMGHFFGPASTQVRDAIAAADAELGRVVAHLSTRGLLPRTNLVVVSDHGMAATPQAQTIIVDDYIDPRDADIADINPTLGVLPKPRREETVFHRLASAHPNLKMYRRDETPEHWRLRGQPRVAPVTGVADEGWVVLTRAEAATYWTRSAMRGQHGYDPRLPSMHGIFVAAGPAFRQGVTLPAFENVSVYNVLAAAMGVQPSPNDGDRSVVRRVVRE